MSIGLDDLREKYGHMDEPQLMQVAREYDTLSDPAQEALRAEFARRGLEPPLVEEVDRPEHRKLVTVKRCRDLSEAIVIRSMLESAGIEVYLYDENVVRLDWAWSNMIGGIRVQVGDGDEAAALELLNSTEPVNFTLEDDTEFKQPHCPICNSTNVRYEQANRDAALLSTFTIGLPLPLGPGGWHCDACGARWEDTEETDAA